MQLSLGLKMADRQAAQHCRNVKYFKENKLIKGSWNFHVHMGLFYTRLFYLKFPTSADFPVVTMVEALSRQGIVPCLDNMIVKTLAASLHQSSHHC